MIRVFSKISLLLATSYLLLPFSTFAQINVTGNGGYSPNLPDELKVNLIPEHPQPRERVSVRLEMYTENLDSADITWLLGGSVVQKGKGLRDFSFITPESGKSTNLVVNITLQSGVSFQKTVPIKSNDLDILWEANSYTPPFYRGKALFPPQGQVKLYALSDRQNLIYKWTINGEVRQELGGYNRNMAIVAGPILGTGMGIEVLATDSVSPDLVLEKSIFIAPTNPSILFYENSPLYGMVFEKSIVNIPLKGEEVSILAVPYNVSKENMSGLNYMWKINGVLATGIAGHSATFRKPEGIRGRSLISLDIENMVKPLQSVENSFSINFE